MNKLDKQYTDLLQSILDYGVEKKDRTGTGTKSIFGYTIRHNMKDGFPLLTTKKMPFKTIVTELLWFLRGDTNIKFLIDNNCHIWDGDAYKNYVKIVESNKELYLEREGYTRSILTQEEFISEFKYNDEFAKKWGNLGPIYGKQWRHWEYGDNKTFKNGKTYPNGEFMYDIRKEYVDQIANLINDLKTNPDSRRLMVNAWNVGEISKMVLPPCHYGFQVYTRELSEKERVKLYEQKTNADTSFFPVLSETLDFHNIPTRAISLMWNQRSVDTFLGLPFNIASYGLLLEIIAKEVNMATDELIGNLGDTHLYLNHIEQAKEQIGRKYTPEERHEMLKESMGDSYQTAVDEQVPFGGGLSEYYESYKIPYRTREPFELPTLKIYSGELDDIAHHELGDFEIINYQSHPTIKAPLSN